MRFNGYRGAMYRYAFNHIGVNGALAQQFNTCYLFGFLLKYFNKQPADGFAFGFGVGFAFQFVVKQLFGVNAFYVEANGFVGFQHLFKFVFAQYAIVYKNAEQVIANGFVYEGGGYGTVNPAAKGHNYLAV